MPQWSQVIRYVVMVSFVVMFSGAGFGQTSLPEKWSGRVSVKVSADVSPLESEITSYINRELRSLGDVSVTDSEPIYVMEIVAIKMTNENDQPVGAALSVLITRPLIVREYLDMWLKDKVEPQRVNLLAQYYADAVETVRHFISYGSDMQVLCRKIVTSFDTQTLMPARKRYNDWIDEQKKLKRQGKN